MKPRAALSKTVKLFSFTNESNKSPIFLFDKNSSKHSINFYETIPNLELIETHNLSRSSDVLHLSSTNVKFTTSS